MFWNDPTLYSANLPYRELGTLPTPFLGPTSMPWQNIPRFIPQTFGMLPYSDPRMFAVHAFAQTPAINPFVQPFGATLPQYNPFMPFMQPFGANLPQHNPFAQSFGANLPQYSPFVQPFNVNLPQYGGYRPFCY